MGARSAGPRGAAVAQPVEHVLGKDGVGGSSPLGSTRNIPGTHRVRHPSRPVRRAGSDSPRRERDPNRPPRGSATGAVRSSSVPQVLRAHVRGPLPGGDGPNEPRQDRLHGRPGRAVATAVRRGERLPRCQAATALPSRQRPRMSPFRSRGRWAAHHPAPESPRPLAHPGRHEEPGGFPKTACAAPSATDRRDTTDRSAFQLFNCAKPAPLEQPERAA